jgi:hypothetical protein
VVCCGAYVGRIGSESRWVSLDATLNWQEEILIDKQVQGSLLFDLRKRRLQGAV